MFTFQENYQFSISNFLYEKVRKFLWFLPHLIFHDYSNTIFSFQVSKTIQSVWEQTPYKLDTNPGQLDMTDSSAFKYRRP